MKLFKKRETGVAGLTTSPAASLEKTSLHQASPTPSTTSTNPTTHLPSAVTHVRDAPRDNKNMSAKEGGSTMGREGGGMGREERTGKDKEGVIYPWSSRPLSNSNPFPRYGHATNALSSKDGGIYIFGGLVRDAAMNDLWFVTPQDMQAKSLATTGEQPSPRVGHAALLIGNAFIVFGGDTKLSGNDTNANNDDALYLLNTTTKIWTVAKVAGARPSGRYGHTLNMLGPKVLVFGGQVEGFFFNDLVAFDLNTLNRASPRWELITPLEGCEPPPSRTNHIAVSHNDKLYIFGGTNGVEWYNDMWRFDPITRAWQMLKCSGFVPQPREGHSAALVGDVIYVFGGRDVDGNDLGDLSAFKISSARWFTFQNMGPCPSPRSGHALCSVGKKIYVVGGEGASCRGDEQHAYILDTTKIRYPGEPSKSAQKMNELTSSSTMQKDATLDGGPIAPRMPPELAQPSIRSVSGQGTMAPSRLPQLNAHRSMLPEMTSSPLQAPRRGSVNAFNQGRNDSPSQRNVSMPTQMNAGQDHRGKLAPPKRSGSLDSMMEPNDSSMQTSTPSNSVTQPMEDRSLNRARSMEEMKTKKNKNKSEIDALRRPDLRTLDDGSKIELAPALRHLDSGLVQTQSSYASDNANQALQTDAPISSTQTGNAQRNPFYTSSQQNGALAASPPRTSQQSTTREAQSDYSDRIAWLEAELKLAKRSGYTVTDKSQDLSDDLPETKPEALSGLIALRKQLITMQADIDAVKARSDEAVAFALSERDAAVREAAFERARSNAMMNMNGDQLKKLDTQKSNALEVSLLESTQQSKNFEQKIAALQAELDAARRSKDSHDELIDKHSKAATEAHERHADLLSQHTAMQSLLVETQSQAQETRARHLEAQSALAERESDSQKLKELEMTHAQHLLAHQAASAATTAATARATQAELALDEQRSKAGILQAQLTDLQAQLETAKAEATRHSDMRDEMEKSMLAARQEAESSHAAMTNGMNDLVAQQQARGLHDPIHHENLLEQLRRELGETRELHTSSRGLIDTHVKNLQAAQARIQELQNSNTSHQNEVLALQRRVATSHDELLELQTKHNSLQSSHDAKQSELEEALLKCSNLQQIMSSRPSRRDSIEKRRSRAFSPMPMTNGRHSQTPDASRLRELEQNLSETTQLHRDVQSSHSKIAEDSNAGEALGGPSGAEEATSSAREATSDASRPLSMTSNGDQSNPSATRRDSVLRNQNKDVQLAQARATEAERQLAESTQNFKERLTQLESDYQSAVHYVKGTEKMLRRMKEELGKYKTANAKLQTQLEQSTNGTRDLNGASTNDTADMQSQLTALTSERDKLSQELAKLKDNLEATISMHGAKVTELERQLSSQSAEQHSEKIKQLEDELEEAHLATRKLEFENRELERGMQESQGKVKMLLDQFEHSVDNYRRQSMLLDDGESDTQQQQQQTQRHQTTDSLESGEHVLAPPIMLGKQTKARTSSTLDLLANELDQLRTEFEGTRTRGKVPNRTSDGSYYEPQR